MCHNLPAGLIYIQLKRGIQYTAQSHYLHIEILFCRSSPGGITCRLTFDGSPPSPLHVQETSQDPATIVYRSLNGTAPRYLAADLRCLSDMPSRRRLRCHSLTSSMSFSRTVQLETELSLWLVLDYGTVSHMTLSRVTLSHFRCGLKTFLFRQSYTSILF